MLIGLNLPLGAIACECKGECAAERAEYHRCPDDGTVEGVACIHPRTADPHARFFVLAEVERCPSLSSVFVRHVVKNLHPTDRLPFEWEGLEISHAGLLPDEDYPLPLEYPTYEGRLVPDKIRYGNSPPSSAPRVSAPRYPLLNVSAADFEPGEVLTNTVETKYQDHGGETREVRVQINSMQEEGSISYEIVRNDSSLAIAIGFIDDYAVARAIADHFSAEITLLAHLVPIQDIEKFPHALLQEDSLVIQPYKDADGWVRVDAAAKEVIAVPLSIMTAKFEPIVGTRILLFAP